MSRPCLPTLLCLLLGSGSSAAGFGRSLASSPPGQLALFAALASHGFAEEAAKEEQGEAAEIVEEAAGGEDEGEGEDEDEGEDAGEGEDEEDQEDEEEDDEEDPAAFIQKFDKNNDGFLEFGEFDQPEDAMDEDREVLKKLIAESDADGDGKISKEELPSLLEAFEREDGEFEEEEDEEDEGHEPEAPEGSH
uniref:EF-hand domain-containing protein n=1 Tax=Alexandrium monilatum TaxID=311494 RepID=A0A7S4RLZ9_9DINO